MAMTLKQFKKSSFKKASYFETIKSEADLDNLRKELIELTNNGNSESIRELAQMEGFDPYDIEDLIF